MSEWKGEGDKTIADKSVNEANRGREGCREKKEMNGQ